MRDLAGLNEQLPFCRLDNRVYISGVIKCNANVAREFRDSITPIQSSHAANRLLFFIFQSSRAIMHWTS
jgi:hypothetical protein